ncbi:MAG TPA: hypothetical protein VMJ10_27295 [Kofleriaceae bacterium]|nr:hypothetical protein [Kofleriaceae bacterium]
MFGQGKARVSSAEETVDGQALVDPDLADKLAVLHAASLWGHSPFVEVARMVDHHFQILGTEDLAVSALEQAILQSGCDDLSATNVREVAQDILRAEHYSGRSDDRLAPLATMTHERCIAFKRAH